MATSAFRKGLSLSSMLSNIRQFFNTLPDDRPRSQIPLVDHLMSGLVLFGLKYASLLQFDNDSRGDEATIHNLHTLYGIERVPSDTFLLERLDELDPACYV